jgi:hypothetical protein
MDRPCEIWLRAHRQKSPRARIVFPHLHDLRKRIGNQAPGARNDGAPSPPDIPPSARPPASLPPLRSRDLWRYTRWLLALFAVMDKAKTGIRRCLL